jgi:putative nucleotidyltransferase with HDIG domain
MIGPLNAALLELQSALTSRALYPASHPVIRSCEKQAFELLCEVLDEQAEAQVFAVGERVIFDNEVLPSSTSLTEALFNALHRRGIDRLTFRHGLEGSELRALLDALASEESGKVLSSLHVHLGYIQEKVHDKPSEAVVAEPGAVPLSGRMSTTLREVWHDVHDGYVLQTDVLGDLVSSISTAVNRTASAVLPLASLKKHDEYTFVHTINVAMLSTALAEAVGLRGRTAHELAIAALLHDIGKQRIPLELLNKDGRFTDDEYRVVQEHPVDGARILLATPGVPEIAPIVAYEHHVRADGGGYPRVPSGWRLNLASRIVQVADVFDALRTHRPYRPAMPIEKIVSTMQNDIGTFFDEDLLQVFFGQVVSRGLPEPAGAAS